MLEASSGTTYIPETKYPYLTTTNNVMGSENIDHHHISDRQIISNDTQ